VSGAVSEVPVSISATWSGSPWSEHVGDADAGHAEQLVIDRGDRVVDMDYGGHGGFSPNIFNG
jgi:hypothetical protein